VDNLFAERQQRLLTEPLYSSSWKGPKGDRRFLAAANIGLFFSVKQPPLVPDALLSVDVDMPLDVFAKRGRAYFIWEYGKPPNVAVEIVSDTRGDEASYKMQQYARGGVTYYVIWDPAHHLDEDALRVFVLRDGTYVRLDQPWLEGVGLGLTTWQGEYEGINAVWLRWCDQNGQVIPTGKERVEQETKRVEQEQEAKEEAVQRAEQEQQAKEEAVRQAEQERLAKDEAVQRAEQERQAKEEAARRADLLAARLRALGIDPDA
jgi:Uma2 family endonuclease